MTWRFRLIKFKFALYGLTHSKCYTCRGPKGLNLNRCCYPCQLRNLLSALEQAEQDVDHSAQSV
jgi:hypothetical protein